MNDPAIEATRANLRRQIAGNSPVSAVSDIVTQLEPLSIGMRTHAPILHGGARLFRATAYLTSRPVIANQVSAPQPGFASIGRLNESGQQVLYTADTAATALTEITATARPSPYCISEWRINADLKVVFANGGIHPEIIAAQFSGNVDSASGDLGSPRSDNESVLSLYREIFALKPTEDARALYNWSIACGRVSGFSHTCGRSKTAEIGSNTKFEGQYPFAGIAYASVRCDRLAFNFAFNDFGMKLVSLINVQWVRLNNDNSLDLLDIAMPGPDGNLHWKDRPAQLQINPGQEFILRKMGGRRWSFESLDGDVPFFV